MRNSAESEITALNDQQVLSIVDSIAAVTLGGDAPQGVSEQLQCLVDVLPGLATISWDQVAAAAYDPGLSASREARSLLKLLHSNNRVGASVDEWLRSPPILETASVSELAAGPVVFTGCIVLIQVVANTRFIRDEEGRWKVDYNPESKSSLNKILNQIAGILASLTQKQ